ncbi:unnamed protein product, partial [Mesorhabditis spiculigera]
MHSVADPELDDDRRLRVQISERDLLCINGCGFYGTPQWGNRCSKCWRAHQIAEKRDRDYARNKTLLTFEKFEEKRKLSTESRSLTFRNIMKKSPSILSGGSGDNSRDDRDRRSSTATQLRTRQLSPDSSEARVKYTDWLIGNLPTSVVQEITRMTKYAENRINEFDVVPEELSDQVQTFYQHLNDRLSHNKFFVNQDPAFVQDVMEQVERYLSVTTYNRLFCPSPEEEAGDLSLQARIRSLNWVTSGFLEMKLDFTKAEVLESLDDAITECISINSPRRMDEKLDCLLKCCHCIFDALKKSGAPTSADEFLPVLIFILIKANPPLLQSNVKYISRYALPHRVMSGESGYFFTNLSCALQFVQNMNHESLKMDKREFEAYTSGQIQPPPSAANCGCNQAISTMEQTAKRFENLLTEQQKFLEEAEEFARQIEIDEARVMEDYEEVFQTYPKADLVDAMHSAEIEEQKTADMLKECGITQ